VKEEGRLTRWRLAAVTGLQLAEFPLPPMQAKMLLASGQHGCGEEIATIAAMLQVQHVFVEPPDKRIASKRHK